MKGDLVRYTTKVAMDSPIIVCSHQKDRSVDNAEDALSKDERLFVAGPGEG